MKSHGSRTRVRVAAWFAGVWLAAAALSACVGMGGSQTTGPLFIEAYPEIEAVDIVLKQPLQIHLDPGIPDGFTFTGTTGVPIELVDFRLSIANALRHAFEPSFEQVAINDVREGDGVTIAGKGFELILADASLLTDNSITFFALLFAGGEMIADAGGTTEPRVVSVESTVFTFEQDARNKIVRPLTEEALEKMTAALYDAFVRDLDLAEIALRERAEEAAVEPEPKAQEPAAAEEAAVAPVKAGRSSLPPFRNAVWQRAYGGSGVENLNSMALAADGGLILVGETTSNDIQPTHGSRVEGYSASFYILKVDASGRKQWDAIYGGSDRDIHFHVASTRDGGCIVAGYTRSEDIEPAVGANLGDADFYVVKLTATGEMEWDAMYGGESTDVGGAVVQTDDGGYMVAGYSYSTEIVPATGENTTANGFSDIYLIKINRSGEKQWDAMLGTEEPDVVERMTRTRDGGYLLSGGTAVVTMDTLYTVKIRADGGMEWILPDIGGAAAAAVGDGYVAVGFERLESRSIDILVAGLSEDGAVEWTTAFGGEGWDQARALWATEDGSVMVAASTSSDDITASVGQRGGDVDIYLVQLDPGGGKTWDALYGDQGMERASDIVEVVDGVYVVGGTISPGLASKDSDFFLMKFALTPPAGGR